MSGEHALAPISIEARTIRKLKLRIIPFILILYIISFLDRINIGFAKLAMDHDLAITSHQFGLAVGIFFIGYALFEIQNNLLLHKIGDRDAIDLHQMFVGSKAGVGHDGVVTLSGWETGNVFWWRALVGVREGPNNRRAYDAVRLSYKQHGFNS